MTPSEMTLKYLAQDRAADAAIFQLAALRIGMKSAYVGRLSVDREVLYTVPSGRVAVIRSAVLCNDSMVASTAKLYLRRSGTSFPVIQAVIPAGERHADNTPIALESGDVIEGDASQTDAIACIISVELHDA